MMNKALALAVVEKDVENAYREAIHKARPKAKITSPHSTDGYVEWGGSLAEPPTVRLLLEAKYDLDFKARVPVCNTLGQCLIYLKKFESSGEPLPNVILVGDKNECFVLSTTSVKGFLDLPIDWTVAPSTGNPKLTRALVDGMNILPYVYDVDSQFNFNSVLSKIETLAADEQHSVKATLANIGAIFTYWQDRVFRTNKGMSAVEEVDVFLRCLFQPRDVYPHPTKRGVLVVPDYPGGVLISVEQYRSFFDHFEQGYKPSEIEAFYANKDRLVEDDARRRQGAFFTPGIWVGAAHKSLDKVLGPNWRDECIVWDPAAGVANLTRDYTFDDLIVSTAERPDVAVIEGQGYNPGASVFQYDFLRSSDMYPRFPVDDERDVPNRDSKGRSKAFVGLSFQSSSPDFKDVGLSELRSLELLAPGSYPGSHPALPDGIIEVVLMGAYKQVRWVDAGGVVTVVTNLHPLRDCPLMYPPGDPVGKDGTPARVDPTVPMTVRCTGPHPAIPGCASGDVLPKPPVESVCSSCHVRSSVKGSTEPKITFRTPNVTLNPGESSPFFETDKKNILPDAVDKQLKAAAKAGKRLVWLMNPPYGTANNAGAKGTSKAGIAKTLVNGQMKKAQLGSPSQQLYAQFMFQCSKVAERYGFAEHTVALFSKPTFISSGSYRKFRDWWYGRYEAKDAFLFQASHFADVKGSWGISFTIWNSPGTTDSTTTIPCTLKDEPKGTFTVVDTAVKALYHSDGREASKWVRESLNKAKGVDAPQLSSGLKVREKGRGSWVPGALYFFGNNANNLQDSATLVYNVSSADTRNNGLSVLPSNWRQALALYGARKLVKGTWINDKDEYLVPTTGPDYEQWVNNCHVYALLQNSNNCSAMRDMDYKNKKWQISNHFFWLSRADALRALDTPKTPALYRDCKTHPAGYVVPKVKDSLFTAPTVDEPWETAGDPYMNHALGGLSLSPEARTVLDKLQALWVLSLPLRESYAAGRPELHLMSWDASTYQLKFLWRDLFPDEWADLQVSFKLLAAKLRPGVYEHGFLLK